MAPDGVHIPAWGAVYKLHRRQQAWVLLTTLGLTLGKFLPLSFLLCKGMMRGGGDRVNLYVLNIQETGSIYTSLEPVLKSTGWFYNFLAV